MKIVCVTGSRDYSDYDRIRRAIGRENPDIIVHGGARGADAIAGRIALSLGCQTKVYHADWNLHGKAAGMIRNREMADGLVKARGKGHEVIVLAFPLKDSKGTFGMIDAVRRRHLDLIIFDDPRCDWKTIDTRSLF